MQILKKIPSFLFLDTDEASETEGDGGTNKNDSGQYVEIKEQ